MAFSSYFLFVGAAAAFLFYVTTVLIYRLYFSPISKFPGPKLAAVTLWYEFYYDVVLRGQYTFYLPTLHAKYGPIIRINPYELHISDPTYYDTLYASSASGEKRDKWEWYTKQFDIPGSMFSTVGHDQHKARRAAFNRFFSMAGARKLQPVVQERVEQLLSRLRALKNENEKPIKINHAFAAFTNDVVMEYSYGRCDHRLEQEDFAPEYHDATLEACRAGSLLKQMIWIFYFVQSLPGWVSVRLSPGLDLVVRLKRQIKAQIIHVKAQPSSAYHDLSHPTLFHEILESNLPESDKSVRRLEDEAFAVVNAGTMTTAWALSVATYHLLASSRVLAKLKTELKAAIPNPEAYVPLSQLEKLPYLVAVAQEAVRLSYGVCTRLQRVSPEKPMIFMDSNSGKQWSIPPGTPVSMTSALIHHDQSIYPDSKSFIPERWIENPRLERYMVSFSKGSRQCLGMNLAYAELYLCLAAIFRRFGSGGENGVRDGEDEGVLELFETGLKDVEIAADCFVPLAAEDSVGIRIKAKP